MRKDLSHNSYPKPVHDLVHLYTIRQLNLNPGFQRKSVWTTKDRSKLLESIIRNYPVPAIFLYRREENGKIVYDVIDGKQRLESILLFMGIMRGNKFEVKTQLDDNPENIVCDWKYLKRKKKQSLIEGYKLYTIEVDGDLSDIIDLFVRINSTGKALTSAEKQHAKYYNSPFLKTASNIAERYRDYFEKNGVLSLGQISRMKHVELLCEIMLSIGSDDVINKKAALDKIMGKGLTLNQINKEKVKVIRVLNRIKIMFPRLKETRFKQLSDFYVLAILISKYEEEAFILTDKNRNKLAWELLREFSNGVDRARLKQKKAEGISESDGIYREYLLTVSQSTDEISQRRKRMNIIDNLIRNIFAIKDKQRGFTVEQRRIIWNSTEERTCQECHKVLTWDDFTIDHIDPHSKGGRSDIENASLMCRKHNSAKGNKIARRKNRE
jgi:glycosyltransferase involved in cell wall biosynthesis